MATTPQGAPSRKCTSAKAKGARSPSTVLAATPPTTPPPSPSASSSSPAVSSASATTTTNGKYRSSASTPSSSSSSSSSSTHHSARSNKTPGSNTAAGSAAKYRKQQQQQQQSPTPPTTKKNKLKLDEQQKKDDNDRNQIEENYGDDDGSSEDNRVRIFVRFRPPRDDDAKKQQQQSSSSSCWTIQQDQYVLSADRDEPFAYDRVFASDTDQCTVFEGTVAEDVRACLQSGVNVTLFAYGQTGSGKTYTVLGTPSSKTAPGLLPRCLDAFFAAAEDGGGSSTSGEVGVHISMYEIYRETIIDLLCTSTTTSASSSSSPAPAPATLNLQEDNDGNVEVVGLSTELARSKAEALDIVERAGSRRATATTACNVASSRSHLVVVMRRGDGETRGGSLTLCDLAGSERVDKTGAEGTVLKEAQHINSSLSTLGNVVHSLASQKKQHVPYRSSRLTHALKQSLGGRSRTRIVVCVSPDVEDVEETMSSLRFAARAKHMARHAPKVEMEGFSPKPGSPEELIWLRKQRQTLVDEVHTLRERVEAVQGGFGGKTTMPLLMEIVLNAAVLVGAACVLGRTK